MDTPEQSQHQLRRIAADLHSYAFEECEEYGPPTCHMMRAFADQLIKLAVETEAMWKKRDVEEPPSTGGLHQL